jgi:plasmid stabilization system protein ParE
VKLFFLSAADADIVRQFIWYLEHGSLDVARRFRRSVEQSVALALSRPQAASPRPVRNPVLHGLRSWPVKGFDEFRIYYLLRQDVFTVVRILHSKRDIGSILESRQWKSQALMTPALDDARPASQCRG